MTTSTAFDDELDSDFVQLDGTRLDANGEKLPAPREPGDEEDDDTDDNENGPVFDLSLIEAFGGHIKLDQSIMDELTDEKFLGKSHYIKQTAGEKCSGPLCRRFNTDKARYARRTKAIAQAIREEGTFFARDNQGAYEGREDETRIIIALLLFTERVIPNQLVSAAERDGIWIPPIARRSEAERTDTIPADLLERNRAYEVKQAAEKRLAEEAKQRGAVGPLTVQRSTILGKQPANLLKTLEWMFSEENRAKATGSPFDH